MNPVDQAEVTAALQRAGRDNPLLGLPDDTGGRPDDTSGRPNNTNGSGRPNNTNGSGRPDDATGTPADAFDARAVVDAVGKAFRTRERRVAASLAVLGYSARLLGPTVALLLRDGILLDVRRERVRYSYTAEHGMRLSLPAPGGWHAEPAILAQQWTSIVVDGHLSPILQLVRTEARVSAGLLWGNVASGLAGALRALDSFDAGAALLDQGPLRGTGVLDHKRFTRRSCCLYYRLPGAGMCGDCALAPGAREILRSRP